MAQAYTRTVTCIICESPAEHHCNTCGDVLCRRCKEMHLKSNAGRNHDVVPYSQRIKLSSLPLQCGDHPSHLCAVWCRTCDKAVCGDCMTSPKHRGHHFLKFDEQIKENREEIQNQFEKYSQLLTDWSQSLQEVEMMQETCEKESKLLDREIVKRADEICMQVRTVERENRKQLHEMKDAYLRFLSVQHKSLEDGVQRLRAKVKELDNTLRSSELSGIMQYTSEGSGTVKPPSVTQPPPLPSFTPGSLDAKLLNEMFGSLSESRKLNRKNESLESEKIKLMHYPHEVAVIKADMYSPSITCVGLGKAWVVIRRGIQLMDRQGEVAKTITIDFTTNDMTVTTEGNILLSDVINKRIMSISKAGAITDLFRTQYAPYGICCLPSGDIVVTFKTGKRVIEYSGTGEIIKQMDRSLFQYPWYVAHSHVNKQLYVSDISDPDFLPATGRVLALDMTGRLQHTYTGPDPTTFTPGGLCTNQAGHILITDINNQRIHITDEIGNFLQFIITREQGLIWPMVIDVDSEGYAWIGEWKTEDIKVVKYKSSM